MPDLISLPGGKVPGNSTPTGVDQVDEPLVEGVVRRINLRHASAQLALCRALGEILLDAFYGGDLDALNRIGRRHASLQAVLNHPELRTTGSQAWYALHLLPQLRALGDAVADALPLSHHRILMHVRDADAKLALAVRAASEELSKRALQDEVERWRQADPRQPSRRLGRPPRPRQVAPVDAAPATGEESSPAVHPSAPSLVTETDANAGGRVASSAAVVEELVESLRHIAALAKTIRVTPEAIRQLDGAWVAQVVDDGERALGDLEEFLDDVRLAIEGTRSPTDD